ncbi:MAG: DUF167 domain-containing protein [Deltaproteobacteria bacterium]|nr:MAG: DUF167 domain-containing protein [Deltaproteobacteria bacterium]
MSQKPTSVNLRTHIKVKVLPRSSTNQIIDNEGDLFKVKLTSPPVEGKANIALIELLAKRLGIAKKRIEIVSGKHSKLKSVLIHGLTLEKITQVLKR